MNAEIAAPGNLVSIKRFALEQGMSEQKARRLCRTGSIPHVRIGGRLYIPMDVYNKFIAERCRQSLSGDVA